MSIMLLAQNIVQRVPNYFKFYLKLCNLINYNAHIWCTRVEKSRQACIVKNTPISP